MSKVDVFTFIKNHKYINYCECVIHPDGEVEYAKPSHIECLVRISGKSRKEIDDLMSIWESPLHWMVNYTRCVAVYTNGMITNKNTTKEQEKTIEALVLNGLTSR